MRCLLLCCWVALVPPAASAQDLEGDWPPLDYLRNDMNAVQAVAHVRIEEAAVVSRIPGYVTWKVSGAVVTVYKGKLEPGAAVIYFHGVEAGGLETYPLGREVVVFLLAEHDARRGPYLTVLENSTLPFSEALARKLRQIE